MRLLKEKQFFRGSLDSKAKKVATPSKVCYCEQVTEDLSRIENGLFPLSGSSFVHLTQNIHGLLGFIADKKTPASRRKSRETVLKSIVG